MIKKLLFTVMWMAIFELSMLAAMGFISGFLQGMLNIDEPHMSFWTNRLGWWAYYLPESVVVVIMLLGIVGALPGTQRRGSLVRSLPVGIFAAQVSRDPLCHKMNWKLETAKLQFGLQYESNLPGLACSALVDGLDSPSLRVLAGLDGKDHVEVRKYLEKVLYELEGEALPTRDEAAWILVRHLIDAIVDGAIEPHEGLHTLIHNVYWAMDWSTSSTKFVGDSIGIQKLYGLCDSFDELSVANYRGSWWKSNKKLLAELQEDIKQAATEYRNNYLAQPPVADYGSQALRT
jgi:hypothetical protein